MKLPDFENFEPFNRLRRAMGATEFGSFSLNYKGQGLTMAELDVLVSKGLDVNFEDITILEDGTLGYKDSRVLVYIRDVPDYSSYYNSKQGENLPRFHVAWCKTLNRMRQKNKFCKYVVSTKTDGKFEICRIGNSNNRKSIEELVVCRNCLDNLSFENYRDVVAQKKDQIVKNFVVLDFFEKYPRQLIFDKPRHSNLTAPLNTYSESFSQTSRELKEKLGWKCQSCGIYLGDKGLKQYLHAHHINSLKNEDDEENLEVLCLKCHAEEDGHGHMKNGKYREFLEIMSRMG